jgi:hypothetical protein
MADPTGRVYRLSEGGKLDMLIGNGPSPNGLVLSPDESVSGLCSAISLPSSSTGSMFPSPTS